MNYGIFIVTAPSWEWSFGPNSTWGSIETTFILKAHPILVLRGALIIRVLCASFSNPFPHIHDSYSKTFFRMSNKEGLTNMMSKFATAYGQSASRPRLDFKLSVVYFLANFLKIAELTYYDILKHREWI